MSITSENAETKPSMVVQDGKSLNIGVLGDISTWYGYNARQIHNRLSSNKDIENIDLYICSNGGNLAEAMKMFEMLKGHPAKVTAYIFGLVASSASFLACCADHVVASKRTIYMVHNPSNYAHGTPKTLKSAYLALEAFQAIATEAYVDKSGIEEAEMRKLMDDESYMSPATAMELGFVDEVVDTISFPFTIPSSYYGYYDDDYYMKSEDGGWLSPDAVYATSLVQMHKKGFDPYEIKAKSNNNSLLNIMKKTKLSWKGIVNMLSSKGVIADDKLEDAEKALQEATDEEVASMVVEEEVDFVEEIKALDKAKLAEMRSVLGVTMLDKDDNKETTQDTAAAQMQAVMDKFKVEMEAIVSKNTELAGQLADMKGKTAQGGGRTPQTNGGNDIEDQGGGAEMKATVGDAEIIHMVDMVQQKLMTEKEFLAATGVEFGSVQVEY